MQVEIIFYDEMSKDVPSPQRHLLRSRLLDLAEYQSIGFKTTFSNNLESSIKSSQFDYVLVISLGNHFGNISIVQNMVNFAINEKTPLVAHLLHQEGCFHFHPQWFLINTSVYKKLRCPVIRPDHITKRSLLMDPIRSKENFHDNYTPHWIAPSKSYTAKTVPGHFFGTYFLDSLLTAGYTIKNIPQLIRYQKSYSYPNENWEELVKCLENKSHEPTNHNVEEFIKKIRGSYLEVYSDLGYYPINTEDIFPVNYKDKNLKQFKYNVFTGVCGGIKPALISGSEDFEPNTQVILFDASQAAIDWQKYLIENWDGVFENLESVYQNFKDQNNHFTSIIDPYANILDKLKYRLDTAKIDNTELKRRWDKFKTYPKSFCKIDLLDNESLSSLLKQLDNPGANSYFWMSNSLHMDWQMFYLGAKHMEVKLQEVLDLIGRQTTSKMVVEHGTVLYKIR
jgi:hypothetical protein